MSNEMTNPFDNEHLEFYVLVNLKKQHSLWPAFKTVPEGWEVVFGPASRAESIDYVEQNWTDMRPVLL